MVGVCYGLRKTKHMRTSRERQKQPRVHGVMGDFMADFSHTIICWKDNTVGYKQPRSFPECIDDNFLIQVIEEPMRRGVMQNLIQGRAGGDCESQRQVWLQ